MMKRLRSIFSSKKILASIALVLVVGGVAYAKLSQKKETIETISPESKILRKQLEVSGVVDAEKRASLRFLAGGKVTYLGAYEGDTVKKWQTIVGIDKSELQKTLQKDLNGFSQVLMDYEQNRDDTRDIHGDKATDRAQEGASLDLRNSALTVELRDIALKNTSLYAPLAGILITSPAKTVGAILTATDVFEIVDPTSMYLDAEVDEADISLVREGQEVTIVLDAYSEEKIQGTVSYIAFKSSESDAGTIYKVRIALPTQENQLKYRLGMNGTANILLDQKQVEVSIPLTALIQRDNSYVVEVLGEDGKTKEVQVEIGMETDEDVEITKGLTLNDKVVKK